MKRLLPIISFILLAVTEVPAQNRISPPVLANMAGPIVKFFPNPAVTSVTFDFQKGSEKGYSIQVYSFFRKKMYEATNLSARTTINLSDFERGVYIYQLYDKTGKMVESGKFQVSR